MSRDSASTGRESGESLAKRLTDLGYVELFHRLDKVAIEAVWQTPGAPEALAKLAADPDSPDEPRFLAAEVLFFKDPARLTERARAALGPVYAHALAGNFPRLTNAWGTPGQLDGLAGQNLVALGSEAVTSLIPLLDDRTPMVYSGSREATAANRYGYRVKDLAAFFISRIRDLPLEIDHQPSARDRAIDRLKRQLGK